MDAKGCVSGSVRDAHPRLRDSLRRGAFRTPAISSSHPRMLRAIAVMVPLLVIVTPSTALSAGGDLDPSFGSGGRVTSDVAPWLAGDRINALAMEPDGRILAAGYSGGLILARYEPDAQGLYGPLDASFGSDGIVASLDVAGAEDVAIRSDGSIVATGPSVVGGADFVLTSYAADGAGPEFTSRVDLSGDDFPSALAIQGEGKIVVGGRSGIAGTFDFALVRFGPAGDQDVTFGSATENGVVKTAVSTGDDSISDIAIQSDGKIVVAGYAEGSFDEDLALARYTTEGLLDTTFGTGGVVTTDLGGNDRAQGVAIQPDGRIVVAGLSGGAGGYDFALARYDRDGTLDATFGSGGLVTTNFGGDDGAMDVAIGSDGKILAAGFGDVGFGRDFALARYGTDGTLDATFGSGGVVTTDFTPDVYAAFDDMANAVTIQPDGRILAAGGSVGDGIDFFSLARFLPTSQADMSVAKSDSQDPVALGTNYTYTLTVTNHGPDPATSVTLTDPLPGAVGFLSAASSQGTCVQSNGIVSCELGSIAVGEPVTVTILVEPNGVGTLSNSATVSGSEEDPNPTNNQDAEQTLITNGLGCTIVGTPGNDVLTGTSGSDVICGLGGDDSITGLGGSDRLLGGSGADLLAGGNQADTIRGGLGSDFLSGGNGADILDGVDGILGNDSLDGGKGSDQCSADPGDLVSRCP